MMSRARALCCQGPGPCAVKGPGHCAVRAQGLVLSGPRALCCQGPRASCCQGPRALCHEAPRAVCCQGPGPYAVTCPGPVSEQQILPQTLQCLSWSFHRFGVAQDGDFSEKRFRDIVNAALANDIGNLLNRTLNLLKKNCGSVMPADSSQVPDNSPVRHTAQQQVTYHAIACRHHIRPKCSIYIHFCCSHCQIVIVIWSIVGQDDAQHIVNQLGVWLLKKSKCW